MSKFMLLFYCPLTWSRWCNVLSCIVSFTFLLCSFGVYASLTVSEGNPFTNIMVGMDSEIEGINKFQEAIWIRTKEGVWRVKKGEERVKVVDGSTYEIKELLGDIWVRTTEGVWRVKEGEKGVKVVGNNAFTYEIKEFQESIWILTQKSIWQFKKGEGKVKVIDGDTYEIKELLGDIWIRTFEGVWRVKKGEQGVLVISGDVKKITERQGAVWVRTNKEVWRFKEGEKGVKVVGNNAFTYEIKEFQESVWVQTMEEVWRFKSGEKGELVVKGSVQEIKEIQELQGSVWIKTYEGVWRVNKDKKGELVVKGSVQEIKELQGAVWVQTTDGVWQFKKGEEKVKVIDGYTYEIKELQGAVWVQTTDGVWQFKKGEEKVKVIDGDTYEIKELQGAVWVQTTDGVWQFKKGEEKVKVIDGDTYEIKELQGAVWVQTTDGVWQFKKGEEKVKVTDGDTYEIKELGGDVWIQTTKGVWCFKKGEKRERKFNVLEGYDGYFFKIKELQGDVWVQTPSEGLWRFKKGGMEEERVVDDYVKEINELQGVVWAKTNSGVWRVKKDEKGVKIAEGEILGEGVGIEELHGAIWVLTEKGVWRVKSDDQGIKVAEGKADKIKELPGGIWIMTDRGVWRVKNNEKGVNILEDRYIVYIIELQEIVWINTLNALYKVYPFKVTITTKSTTPIFSDIESFFPEFWVGGDRTLSIKLQDLDSGTVIYDFNDNHPFNPQESSWSIKGEEENSVYPTARLEVKGFGDKSISYNIKDDWFNHFQNKQDDLHAFVIPGPAMWPVVIAGLWMFLFIILFIMSPWWLFAHNLLMNPFLRKIGYFGLFPLFISSFPPLRRHIMRRYFCQMNRELEENFELKNYVDLSGNFEPYQFVQSHLRASSFLIFGPSGIGKSAFLYRMIDVIINTKHYKSKWVPVFLPSISYQASSLEDALANEFQRLGQIMDRELIKWLLKQGGFALFIDGLNEVTADQISAVAEKSRSLSGTNAVFFTSQERHKELLNTVEFSMYAFNEKEIKEYLIKTLGKEEGDLFFESITEQMLPILAIPRNLTTLVQIHSMGKKWQGTTEVDLYKSFFDRILSAWQHAGADDDKQNLLKIAEQSWKERKPKFSVEILTENALHDLFEFRILVHRGKESAFAHDRLRAYLVSRVLSSQWRKETFESLDANWSVPLQMLSDGFTDQEEVRDLCEKVLEKRIDIAEDLYKHINSQKPSLVSSWKESFYQKLGQKRIEE